MRSFAATNVAILVALAGVGCAEDPYERVARCRELVDRAYVCVEYEVQPESVQPSEDPKLPPLRLPARKVCKRQARDRWAPSRRRELEVCKAVLQDFKRRGAAR